MGPKEKINSDIYNQLIIIKTALSQLLVPATFERVHKIYKQISLKIGHLSKYTVFAQLSTMIKQCLEECMQTLAVIVHSSEHGKHGHAFVLFNELIKKYQAMSHRRVSVNQEAVIGLICRNDSCAYSQAIKEGQIELSERDNVSLIHANQCLNEIANNNISLQNPQCVTCSQIFMPRSKLNNYSKHIIVNLRHQDSAKQSLGKLACGIINMGGGTIIIGLEKSQGKASALGLTFDSPQSVSLKQQQIKQTLNNLQPSCHYNIERVGLIQNLLNQQNQNESNNSFCFRIRLFGSRNIVYTKHSLHNEKSFCYEIFKLNKQLNPQKVKFTKTQKIDESQYTLIHQRFNNKQKVANPHQNINCYRPLSMNWSISSKPNTNTNTNINNQLICPMLTENEGEIKLKYKNMSLLIVQSKNNDRAIKQLDSALKKYKVTYELIKPFSETFPYNDKMRSVWLLSHEASFLQVRGLLTQFESYQLIKCKMITALPVYNAIQLDAQKFAATQSKFNAKYHQRYADQYRKQLIDHGGKKLISLSFSNLSKAIYGYITFQWLNIWPYFTKEGTVYKKKV